MHSWYGITFDIAGWWRIDNETARNVMIFDVDNSSPSHSYNCKIKKKFSHNPTKVNTKLCLNLHYNANNSYFL